MGAFANEKGDLEPNMFARVKVEVGPSHEALFVAEAALGSDQGFRYLYVVNEKNEAEYTRVKPGQKQDGRIAVTAAPGYKELTKDTQVVVDGLQSIHPVLDANGKPQPVKVAATVVDMPKVKADEDAAAEDKGQIRGEERMRRGVVPLSTGLTPPARLKPTPVLDAARLA